MAMHVALHIKANMVELYIHRHNGGRGNISVPVLVENERRTQYLPQWKEDVLSYVAQGICICAEGVIGKEGFRIKSEEKVRKDFREIRVYG